MAPKKKTPGKRARSAIKGRFVTLKEAARDPTHTVVETVKPRKKPTKKKNK